MGQREEDTVRVVWVYAESWLQAAARRLKTKHLVLSSPGFEFFLQEAWSQPGPYLPSKPQCPEMDLALCQPTTDGG